MTMLELLQKSNILESRRGVGRRLPRPAKDGVPVANLVIVYHAYMAWPWRGAEQLVSN